MFINKLKTKLNGFLEEWFQTQREFTVHFDEEMTPQEPNKCLQMLYLSARKRDGRAARHLCAKLVVIASDKGVKNHHHFLPDYPTVKLRGSVNIYH